ncbi:unnamed protein product, partial [Ixodes pacificus]
MYEHAHCFGGALLLLSVTLESKGFLHWVVSRPDHFCCRPETKTEASKRRHASGNRQLLAINDNGDAMDMLSLLGIRRPEEGQYLSFGQYLVSSRQPHGSGAPLRWSKSHEPELPVHSHVGRCVSYDAGQATTPPSANSLDKSFEWSKDDTILPHCCVIPVLYTPDLLDNPELIAGKHSTLLTFPSYIVSGLPSLTAQYYLWELPGVAIVDLQSTLRCP